MLRLNAAATISPTGNAVSRFPAIAPRMRLGLNSEPSVEVTGTSPPRPKLERKRKTASDATFQDVATRPVNSGKMPMVAEHEVRRPMETETVPQNNGPTKPQTNPTADNHQP